jgi:multicomponent Na+:H+ antiporter subunit C
MESSVEFWRFLTSHFNYIVVIVLMMTGLYIVISTGNLVKKLVGLGVFQTAVFQLYITMGKVSGGRPPILQVAEESGGTEHKEALSGALADHAGPLIEQGEHITRLSLTAAKTMDEALVDGVLYSNPLPHVLILTAIVVGVATLAVGLALVVRIQEAYGAIEEEELQEADYQQIKGAV